MENNTILQTFKTLSSEEVNKVVKSGETLLTYYCRNNDAQSVKALLENPAIDLTVKNSSGKTALDVVISNGNFELLDLLSKKSNSKAADKGEMNAEVFHKLAEEYVKDNKSIKKFEVAYELLSYDEKLKVDCIKIVEIAFKNFKQTSFDETENFIEFLLLRSKFNRFIIFNRILFLLQVSLSEECTYHVKDCLHGYDYQCKICTIVPLLVDCAINCKEYNLVPTLQYFARIQFQRQCFPLFQHLYNKVKIIIDEDSFKMIKIEKELCSPLCKKDGRVYSDDVINKQKYIDFFNSNETQISILRIENKKLKKEIELLKSK